MLLLGGHQALCTRADRYTAWLIRRSGLERNYVSQPISAHDFHELLQQQNQFLPLIDQASSAKAAYSLATRAFHSRLNHLLINFDGFLFAHLETAFLSHFLACSLPCGHCLTGPFRPEPSLHAPFSS